jgi:hypothetical protein
MRDADDGIKGPQNTRLESPREPLPDAATQMSDRERSVDLEILDMKYSSRFRQSGCDKSDRSDKQRWFDNNDDIGTSPYDLPQCDWCRRYRKAYGRKEAPDSAHRSVQENWASKHPKVLAAVNRIPTRPMARWHFPAGIVGRRRNHVDGDARQRQVRAQFAGETPDTHYLRSKVHPIDENAREPGHLGGRWRLARGTYWSRGLPKRAIQLCLLGASRTRGNDTL